MYNKKSQFIYTFETELYGFINLDAPGGKYNTCSFRFQLPSEVIDLVEEDREELLNVARSKVQIPQRLGVNPPKWDVEGKVKYSFGGDTTRISPVIIDEYGDPFPTNLLRAVREGTKVQILMEQKPYWKPAIGTTLVVHGIQIIELVSAGSVQTRTYQLEEVQQLMGCPQFKEKVSV